VRIPSDVARKIGHYVYLYVDPRTRRPFYVGKGKGSRALAHLSTIKRSRKATLVRHLRRAHRSPQIDAEPGGLCAVLEKVSQGRLLRPPTGWYAGRMVPDLPDNGLTLDTSAVITAFEPTRRGYAAMKRLIAQWKAGQRRLYVSRRTLAELRQKPDDKLVFAELLEVLPYYMIGTWDDFEHGITWNDLAGTWNVGKINDALQKALPVRARVGILDRGIIVDSMMAGVRRVVTTDEYLLGRAASIEQATGVRPVHPDEEPSSATGSTTEV